MTHPEPGWLDRLLRRDRNGDDSPFASVENNDSLIREFQNRMHTLRTNPEERLQMRSYQHEGYHPPPGIDPSFATYYGATYYGDEDGRIVHEIVRPPTYSFVDPRLETALTFDPMFSVLRYKGQMTVHISIAGEFGPVPACGYGEGDDHKIDHLGDERMSKLSALCPICKGLGT